MLLVVRFYVYIAAACTLFSILLAACTSIQTFTFTASSKTTSNPKGSPSPVKSSFVIFGGRKLRSHGGRKLPFERRLKALVLYAKLLATKLMSKAKRSFSSISALDVKRILLMIMVSHSEIINVTNAMKNDFRFNDLRNARRGGGGGGTRGAQ